MDRTNFEREGKISGRTVNLHRLYKMVMERGGYDKLSEERMAWRQLVRPFGFTHQVEGAATFQIKSLYYRNLAYVRILFAKTDNSADLEQCIRNREILGRNPSAERNPRGLDC
jgi:ARID/BRIGHT DNA binding domain